jgi:hypothetical protein
MASKKSGVQNPSTTGELDIREFLKTGASAENFAELAAVEVMREGLLRKDASPKVFLPLVQFLYKKYKDYNAIASKIGGKQDDHTVQQWVRVSQAWVQEPDIMNYLSERPTATTLTVTKAYRIISKFQDAYISLKVIELMVGLSKASISVMSAPSIFRNFAHLPSSFALVL